MSLGFLLAYGLPSDFVLRLSDDAEEKMCKDHDGLTQCYETKIEFISKDRIFMN